MLLHVHDSWFPVLYVLHINTILIVVNATMSTRVGLQGMTFIVIQISVDHEFASQFCTTAEKLCMHNPKPPTRRDEPPDRWQYDQTLLKRGSGPKRVL